MTDAYARLHPPEAILEVARRLVDAGYETWCVGGAVRDALLGHAHLDWDLATAAHPRQVQKLFRKTVPVGIEFGTVGVFDRDGRMHEVTTFRRDVKTDGRHAVVEFGASLDDDLARRDFTINAMAFNPIDGRLHDPFGGQRDLAARRVRAVGDADARMTEDRLRALRAIRFAARFSFDIDPDTWQAIVRSSPFLGRLSAERVKQEIEKTMEQVDCPSRAFRLWRESGAFAVLLPQLASIDDHQLAVADYLALPGTPTRSNRRALRIAGLLSSLDGKAAEQMLRGLKFSNHDISSISALVDRWRRLGSRIAQHLAAGTADDARLRRWVSEIGRLRVSAFMRLVAANWNAQRGQDDFTPSAAAARSLYRRMQRIAFHDPIEIADLAIDGDDLRSTGIRSGPMIGRALAHLLDLVLQDPARNQRETLLDEVSRWYQAQVDASEGTSS